MWAGTDGAAKPGGKKCRPPPPFSGRKSEAGLADHYCLPESDPCYSTLEAYKSAVDAQLKAFMQAVQYLQYGGRIEQWRQCCPGKNEEVERWRSKQPDPEPLRKLVLPANI